ncbi:MAG: hypothetical protein R2747_18165 [Pyrinomonadaceae bacterium]
MDKQQSMMAVMRLYEMRREEKMRAARRWFFSEFSPRSAMDILQLYRQGEEASAYFRMVTSFWDMAASFVLNDALDEKIFLDTSGEIVFVYAKIAPYLDEIREIFREDDYLINLEQMSRRVPDLEKKLEARKRLFALWTKEPAEEGAAG